MALIQVPVLLVAVEADDVEMVETQALLTHADLVTIPVGHWIHEEARAEFLGATQTFLEQATQGHRDPGHRR